MSDSSARPIRVIVAGTGWGCLAHVPALRAAGFEVAALVGNDRERTADRARRLSVPVATTSLEQALAVPGVRAAVIATPPSTHYELTSAVIAAGKHVLCEKPFTTGLDDARSLLRQAEEAGVVHVLGQEMRWLKPQVGFAIALADGLIGAPRFATFVRLSNAFADPAAEVPGWFTDKSRFGGWLNAEIPHTIDTVRTTLGEFASVTGIACVTSDHDWATNDSFAVQFTLVNGLVGVIQATQGAVGPPTAVQRISGTAGTVSVTAEGEIALDDASGRRLIEIPSEYQLGPALDLPVGVAGSNAYARFEARATMIPPATARLAGAFRDRILGLEPPKFPALPTFFDGVANTVVHEAIVTSATEGRTVTLE